MPNTTSNLLNAEEQLDLYGIPILNDLERTEYFTLNPVELKVLRNFKQTSDAVYFVISLIFYKLKHTLLEFTYQEVTQERQHVLQRFFPNKSSPRSLPNDPNKIARIRKKVLEVCGHHRFNSNIKSQIEEEMRQLAPRHPRQRQLCKAALDLFIKHQCEIPRFTTLQNLITNTWRSENKRVVNVCYHHTNSSQRKTVLALLEQTDNLHRVVSIKKDMKSFTNTELLNEIEKHKQLQPIFRVAEIVLPKLRLPISTINYYASMINYYNGARLKDVNTNSILLYLLCYSFSRFQMVNDNLLEALKKRTLDYNVTALDDAKKKAAKMLEETKEPRQKASQLLMAIHHSKKQSIPKSVLYKHIPKAELLAIAIFAHDFYFSSTKCAYYPR